MVMEVKVHFNEHYKRGMMFAWVIFKLRCTIPNHPHFKVSLFDKTFFKVSFKTKILTQNTTFKLLLSFCYIRTLFKEKNPLKSINKRKLNHKMQYQISLKHVKFIVPKCYPITYTAIKQVQIPNSLHCQNTEFSFNWRYIHSTTKREQPSSRV